MAEGRRKIDQSSRAEGLLKHFSISRFSPLEMKCIFRRVAEKIPQRILQHQSYPTFLTIPPEDISSFEGQSTIALEIGGTNMRAALAQINNGQVELTDPMEGKLNDNSGQEKTVFTGPEDFFDHVFAVLPNLAAMLKANPGLPLSIVFSFPGQPVEKPDGSIDCLVEGLTKGFSIPGMEGQNFGELFNAYLVKTGIRNEHQGAARTVIFNDTPILANGEDNMGVVEGTGCNMAVRVSVGKLREILGRNFAPGWDDSQTMLANLESGGLDAAAWIIDQEYTVLSEVGCHRKSNSIVSRIDSRCDTDGQGKHLDEKLMSGKYLGLQLQLAMRRLAESGVIHRQIDDPRSVETAWKSELISEVLADNWEHFPAGINKIEKKLIRKTGEIIRDRAAQILAAHLAGALEYMDERSIRATVEGSIFWKMPGFKEAVITELAGMGVENAVFRSTGDDESDKFGSLKRGAITGLHYIHTHPAI